MRILSAETMTAVIGIVVVFGLSVAASGRLKDAALPMPTSETIPYVAEVLGATSYEETLESAEATRNTPDPTTTSWTKKRVQRKLNFQAEGDKELDPEHEEYQEYQGNKTRVMGRPGVDFPVLQQIPKTRFSCRNLKKSGYYADLDTGCQVFHICDGGRKISFLCPNGTIFRQTHLICDWWFRVDCERSLEQYEESAELLAHDQMIYKKRTEEIANAMRSSTGTSIRAPNSRQGSKRNETSLESLAEPTTDNLSTLRTTQVVGNRRGQGSKNNPKDNGNYYPTANSKLVSYQLAADESSTKNWFNAKTTVHTGNPSTVTNMNYSTQNSASNRNRSEFTETMNQPSHSVPQGGTRTADYQSSYKANSYNGASGNSYTEKQRNSEWIDVSDEREQQIPAETASFASNKHRFANQLDQNYYKKTTYIATPTNNFAVTGYTKGNDNSEYPDQFSYGGRINNSTDDKTVPPGESSQTTYMNSAMYQSPASTYTIPTFPSTTLGSLTSQNHNSHMQPYSSMKEHHDRNQANVVSSSQQPQTTWWPTSTTSTLPTISSGMDSSLYNSYTAGLSSLAPSSVRKVVSSSASKPYRSKSVFNVKIKPSKDYSLLELHRRDPTTSTTTVTNQYETVSTYTSPANTNNFQPSIWHNGEATNSPTFKYATVNISGNTEEIRPEVVNSLTDPVVKPTSANALLTFANYFVSTDLKTTSGDSTTIRPVVSDLVINQQAVSSSDDAKSTTIKPITSTNGEDLPAELSENTKDSYSFLFSSPSEQNNDLTREESGSAVYNLNRAAHKQTTQRTTVKPTTAKLTTTKPNTKSEAIKFRDSSELRELAQVFSRALSAYLEDPETFKEILAQVRPTEPNLSEQTSPNPEDEVLDFSDANQGRLETTGPPSRLSDVGDGINIGEINSLVPASRDDDSSYENNVISRSTPKSVTEIELTTQSTIVSDHNTHRTKQGTLESSPYFPTAGTVSDSSRPRYGGFHNNTDWESSTTSPFEVNVNLTESRAPLITISSTAIPYTNTEWPVVETTTFPGSEAAQQVNNLLGSNILYGPSTQFTSSSEDDSRIGSYEQENFLQASGSQNIVAGQNYVALAQHINNYQKSSSEHDLNHADVPSVTGNGYFKDELLPYFGQEPPFESISQPSAFQTQGPGSFGHRIQQNYSTDSDVITQPSINSFTIDNQHVSMRKEFLISDRMGTDESDTTTTWTSSPYVTTQYSSPKFQSVHMSTTSVVKPTTYHPSQSLPTTEEPAQFELTTTIPTTTDTSTDIPWTTLSPSHDEEVLMLVKAKEMFGMLNETTSNKLMEMIHEAESNMTIRKLVLLLVNEGDHEKTETSRMKLINALLSHDDEETTTTMVTSSKMKVTKITRVRAGSSRSLKTLRATSEGSNIIRATDEANIANTAKFYIPLEPLKELTTASTTTQQPTTPTPTKLPYDSDARALELLKTLYNLAAKWG